MVSRLLTSLARTSCLTCRFVPGSHALYRLPSFTPHVAQRDWVNLAAGLTNDTSITDDVLDVSHNVAWLSFSWSTVTVHSACLRDKAASTCVLPSIESLDVRSCSCSLTCVAACLCATMGVWLLDGFEELFRFHLCLVPIYREAIALDSLTSPT